MDPFDRLIKLIDEFVAANLLHRKFYAQIGKGKYRPKNIPYCEFLNPEEYQACVEKCSLVVSHAGMGTIITAIELNKPIVILPKRASLNEQRNEHQLATAHHFHKSPLVIVAKQDQDLSEAIFRANSIALTPESGILKQCHPCEPALIQFV
jgi:UDP-N-acetylglucosamine transferase subunit ALG13